MGKKFFCDIYDISFFIECERIKHQNNNKLNEYDYLIVKKIKKLCDKQTDLINNIDNTNFKKTMQNLVRLDAKIESYLFFLIHDEFLDYRKIDQIVESECLEDYYIDLSHDSFFNKYKLITIPELQVNLKSEK